MSSAIPVPGEAPKKRAPVRYYCELDRWSFDPRYTDGRCPICGWAPEGAPSAPLWLVLARKLEWEITGLFVLLVVLVVLAAVVAHAAGYRIPLLNSPAHAAPASVASPARTSASPTKAATHTPTPQTRTTPTPTH